MEPATPPREEPRPTALRRAIRAILADGEGHRFSEVFFAVEALIPPEAAYRCVRSYDRTKMPLGQVVRKGKRRIVRYYLRAVHATRVGGPPEDRIYRLGGVEPPDLPEVRARDIHGRFVS